MSLVLIWSLALLVLQLVNLAEGTFFKNSDFHSPKNWFNAIKNDTFASYLENGCISSPQKFSNSLPPLSGVLENIATNTTAEGRHWQALSGLSPPIISNVLTSISAETKTCDTSTVFRIQSFADLNKVRDEDKLECLFYLGLSPKRPPVGMYHGHVLKLFNTDVLNKIVKRFWSGKMAFKTQCGDPSTSFYMVLNLLSSNMKYSALLYTGELMENLHPSEHKDGKKSLFIDYATDFCSICHTEEEDQTVLESTKQTKLEMDLGVANPPFINYVIDLMRVVGKTPDGGYVMLGKTLAKNPLRLTGARTVAWWAVINYDYPAYPEIPETLGPLREPFSFTPYPLGSFIQDNLTFPSLLANPQKTLQLALYSVLRRPMGLSVIDFGFDMRRQSSEVDDKAALSTPANRKFRVRGAL